MVRQVVWLAVVWVEGWVHQVVLLAFLLTTVTSCSLSQTQQKKRSWKVDMKVFEAQEHSRLDSAVLEGYYILASSLGPSSGVGTRQMWMQAPRRPAEGLLLKPHSLILGLFLGST